MFETGPGTMIISGANHGADVILTGLLEETLEGLVEMVIMVTSSIGTTGIIVFSNIISLLSIRR